MWWKSLFWNLSSITIGSCKGINFLNISYWGCTYFVSASISYDSKIKETCFLYLCSFIFIHALILIIQYHVYYIIVLLDYLWVIHRTVSCHGFFASNPDSTISNFVLFLVFKSHVWVLQQTDSVILLRYKHIYIYIYMNIYIYIYIYITYYNR